MGVGDGVTGGVAVVVGVGDGEPVGVTLVVGVGVGVFVGGGVPVWVSVAVFVGVGVVPLPGTMKQLENSELLPSASVAMAVTAWPGCSA